MDATATLRYTHIECAGERAVAFNRWVEIAESEGATRAGYYDFDPKKKTVAALNLTFEGSHHLIYALQCKLMQVQGLA